MKNRNCILFDLDGTLSDLGEGIIGSLIHALRHFGIEGDPALLRTFIGPPLVDSFRLHFNFDEEQTAEAIRVYRAHFHDHGIFKNVIYPGIPELLRDLTKQGKTLAIATTKPTVYALEVLKFFGIDQYFPEELVMGSFLDGRRTDKSELIATVLKKLGGAPADKVMVGDRKFDIIGAKANGLDVIGVTYGYGEREELEVLAPTTIVSSVEELRRLLLG